MQEKSDDRKRENRPGLHGPPATAYPPASPPCQYNRTIDGPEWACEAVIEIREGTVGAEPCG